MVNGLQAKDNIPDIQSYNTCTDFPLKHYAQTLMKCEFHFSQYAKYYTCTMQVIFGKNCMSKNNEVSNISDILT